MRSDKICNACTGRFMLTHLYVDEHIFLETRLRVSTCSVAWMRPWQSDRPSSLAVATVDNINRPGVAQQIRITQVPAGSYASACVSSKLQGNLIATCIPVSTKQAGKHAHHCLTVEADSKDARFSSVHRLVCASHLRHARRVQVQARHHTWGAHMPRAAQRRQQPQLRPPTVQERRPSGQRDGQPVRATTRCVGHVNR
jgi:hypothetical protein